MATVMTKVTTERAVAGNIKKYLQIAGMNQGTLARMVNIHPTAFSHKMHGKNSREFNTSDLALIARALSRKCGFRITAADLMKGVE